jgi:hypothetical protein
MTIHRVGYKTTAPSSKHGDATSAILILVIACLVLAILLLGTPDSAQLRLRISI